MKKIYILVFFYFIFLINAHGFISNPYDDYNKTQNSFFIKISKNVSDNTTLYFKHTADNFLIFKMNDEDYESTYIINDSCLKKQGVYEYYFTDNELQFLPDFLSLASCTQY